jgi:hypothetical protein
MSEAEMMLSYVSRFQFGVHLGSARCTYCSSSEVEMSEVEMITASTSAPLGVQNLHVERSRDAF